MHPEATFPTHPTHPTRRAPLCPTCAHFAPEADCYPKVNRPACCNHPSTPRHPITGDAVLRIHDMRSAYSADSEFKGAEAHCGPAALLYQRKLSAAEVPGQQTVANAVESGTNLPQPTGHLVPQHAGELVGGASAHEGDNQLRMSGGVTRAEGRVD